MPQDKRPDAKPKKHPELWQSCQWLDEFREMRKRHTLRISSAERGKSNLIPAFEREMLERFELDKTIKEIRKLMIHYGQEVGPVWDWLTSIKGLGAGSLAAELLSHFDDVALYATVSKFWRFSGWAVIDGKIDRCTKGEKSHYNRRLKATCFLIADQFVRQQTPLYADIYYAEKDRQKQLHPEPICKTCGAVGVQVGKNWKCTKCKATGFGLSFTPAHVDKRAKRKMIKIFLQHLWVIWRESEGLPVSEPYVQAMLGHTNIVEPSIV